ncbi:MAG: SDR family oxidoreductase [Sphingobacteriia bacterium]|nr:SDR family oxidoreductase [Sphingobacteriia bacterium]
MNKNFQNICFITGVTSKLGTYLVEHFVNLNYYIIGTYNLNDSQAQEILNKYQNILLIKTDQNNVKEFTNNCLDAFKIHGFPKIIINNAAVFINDNFNNFTLENFDYTLNVNLKSCIYLISKVKDFQENFIVINLLDYFDNKLPTRNFFSYGISKSLLFSLTKSLAVTLAPNVRINGVALGPVIRHENQDLSKFNDFAIDNLLKVKLEVNEIIATIDLLVNNHSLTGEVIHLDGGRNLMKNNDYF